MNTYGSEYLAIRIKGAATLRRLAL